MENLIYQRQDGSYMDEFDLMQWIKMKKNEYPDWSFDEITGGPYFFIDIEKYREFKILMKKLKIV